MSVEIPPPPRIPSKRARQLIHAYTGRQLVVLLGGVICLMIGAPLSVVFCRALPGEVAISLSTRTCVGKIVGTRLQQNVEINGRHPTELRFTYEVDGESLEGESSMLDPGMLGAGSVVTVEYASSDPELARLRGGTYGTFPLWVGFVGLFPLLGLVMAGGAMLSNRREIRAFRDGTVAYGRVTNVGLDRSITVNGRHPLRVQWSFDVLGTAYQGSLSSLDPEKLRDFRMDQAVTVLYLPGDPRANTLWVE